jgi:rhamnogalacturonyl hydrolase YesR
MQQSWPLPDFERPESIETSSADDFGRPLDSWLPEPVRLVWGAIEGGARKGLDMLWPDERDTPDGAGIRAPLDRAREAQRALVDEHAFLGSEDRFHNNGWQVWRTEAWPLGQVLHGRIALAMQGGDWDRVDAVFRDFEAYRINDGFAGGAGDTARYYDDNAWIGLAAMQAWTATGDDKYLRHAERTFRMVRTGQHPEGGLYWVETDRSGRHTCSVAPAAQLAMRLHEATGDERYLRFATEQASWLNAHLRMPSGLYADNLHDNGTLGTDTYSYNQGTPIGLDVQLYRATGDQRFLDRARQTADAALTEFQGERLWQQAPVFNTIFFRNLLALHAVAPDPRYVGAVDAYLERAWDEGRNPDTGLFDQGGIGRYGDVQGSVIDQGALSQLYAIRALPPEQWVNIT